MDERTPIRWIEFSGHCEGGMVPMKARAVGKHLVVLRNSARYEDEHTMFGVWHVPTGYRLAGFSSEAEALLCASDLDATFGDKLSSTDPAVIRSHFGVEWDVILGCSTDDDEWLGAPIDEDD